MWFTFCVALLAASSAAAHDLYLMANNWTPAPGASVALRFENGDDFPKGESAVDPSRLLETDVLWSRGQKGIQALQPMVRFTAGVAEMPGEDTTVVVTARTEPRFIELEPAKFESYLQGERLNDVIQERAKLKESGKPGRELYGKFVKAILRVGKGDKEWNRITGQTIEFVPEADPYGVKVGGQLPVRLYFQGSPAAGVPVEVAFLQGDTGKRLHVGTTDSQGRIRIPISASGPHRLHAIKMVRLEGDAKADWQSYWANLTFGVR